MNILKSHSANLKIWSDMITKILSFVFVVNQLLGFFCRFAHAEEAQHELQEIHLKVGETLELTFPGDLGLRVSKKGIVHPYSLGQGLWQITGIRSGIVILEYQATKSQRYLVRVSETIAEKKKREVLIPDWICKAVGITCDQAMLKISGFAPDLSFWHRTHLYCRKLPGCHDAVSLTPDQKKLWHRRLSLQLGKNIEVSATEHDSVLVLGDCRSSSFEKLVKYVNDQTGNMQKDGLLVVRCFEDHYRDRYQVEIQMVRVEDLDRQNNVGLNPRIFTKDPHQLGLNLAEQMDRLIENHHAKVVAHPVINLVTGSPAKIISGGEFAIGADKNGEQDTQRAPDHKVEWKNTGLELELEINPISAEKMSLKYKSQIKVRTAAESLSVQMLSGEIDLDYGKRVLLGKIDFDQESTRESGGLLSELPVLGDLFKESFESGSRSEVYLWVTLIPSGKTL